MTKITITNQHVIKYSERENALQKTVYAKKVNAKTMTKEAANRNFLIVKRLGELAKLIERKGFTFNHLFELLEALPDKS